MKEILVTCYMGTKNSSHETKSRAKSLAAEVNSIHYEIKIDQLFDATLSVFSQISEQTPKFESMKGSAIEDLALQNIQARQRMVMSYLIAQLSPWMRQKNGFLLVLGSGNLDETLRGYLTKYDCSSADINPIGGINKTDLKGFLKYAKTAFNLPSLDGIIHATPTAELRPLSEDSKVEQADEVEMGMTYAELDLFG